jgi:hypothetical protein
MRVRCSDRFAWYLKKPRSAKLLSEGTVALGLGLTVMIESLEPQGNGRWRGGA